jgi:hypothetical protein
MAVNYNSGAIASTLASESDLSAAQYTFVIQGVQDLACKSPANGTSQPIGVVANKPAAGQAATVVHAGVTQVKCGGTITRGDLLKLKNDTSGTVEAATAATGATFQILGRALQSGAANNIITALVDCLGSGGREA